MGLLDLSERMHLRRGMRSTASGMMVKSPLRTGRFRKIQDRDHR